MKILIRLDKFLCDAGAGSRSQVRQILKAGRVTADGVPQRDPGAKVDPETMKICLDGEPIRGAGRVVVMLNKPAGCVTATRDRTEKTVMDILPPALRGRDLKPVGRLDKQTEGLLLLTNDGDLLHRLISPKKEVPKVYYARHEGMAAREDVEAFARGLTLGDGTLCRPAILEPLGAGESRVTVYEGKYHQVRRMLASRGLPVTYLERQREGALSLGDLPRGMARILSEAEIDALTE